MIACIVFNCVLPVFNKEYDDDDFIIPVVHSDVYINRKLGRKPICYKSGSEFMVRYDTIIIIIIIIIQHLYSAIMSYADTEALVAPVKSE